MKLCARYCFHLVSLCASSGQIVLWHTSCSYQSVIVCTTPFKGASPEFLQMTHNKKILSSSSSLSSSWDCSNGSKTTNKSYLSKLNFARTWWRCVNEVWCVLMWQTVVLIPLTWNWLWAELILIWFSICNISSLCLHAGCPRTAFQTFVSWHMITKEIMWDAALLKALRFQQTLFWMR